MIWVVFAIVGAMMHGLANIMDNYFTNKLFNKLHVLVFYATIINVLFLPIIFLFQFPDMISFNMLPFFVILGLTNLVYLLPYYKALQNDDTSVVASLFSVGKIFVPILAFLFVGEVLNLNQYVGFILIIISSTLLTFNNHIKIKFNSSFFYMILCSFFLSIEIVIFKYILYEVSWATAIFWSSLFSIIMISPILFIGKYRTNIVKQIKQFKNNSYLFVLEEFLTFGGEAAFLYAFVLAPVTLVEGIASMQSIFVLLYAVIFSRYIPKIFRERIDHRNIIKKIILFIMIIVGIICIIS